VLDLIFSSTLCPLVAQDPNGLQQNRCLSVFRIAPPTYRYHFPHMNQSHNTTQLNPPIDPDAKEEGDKNKPVDVPAAAEANVVRDPELTEACTRSSSIIVRPAKSTGVLYESISQTKRKNNQAVFLFRVKLVRINCATTSRHGTTASVSRWVII
jgi:hypothetical protein